MSDFDKFLKKQKASPQPTAPPVKPRTVPSITTPPATASPSFAPPPGAQRAPGFVPRQGQPVLRQNPASVWGRLETALFNLDAWFHQACGGLAIEAYIGRSNLFDYPFAIFFECWLPVQTGDVFLTERLWMKVTLVPRPYHQHEIEYHIATGNRGEDKDLGAYGSLDAAGVRALLDHLVERKPKPALRPKLLGANDVFGGERNEFVGTREYWIVRWLGWIPIIGYIVHAISHLIASRKGLAIRSSGKPEREPRILNLYDSWQTVVFGAASGESKLRQRFEGSLACSPIPGLAHAVERIQYRSLDVVEEREQIVLTAGRGVIYCQLYVFGSDLYVGWQSFLNRGRWVEEKIGEGRDTATGRLVELRTVVRGTQAFSEYDVMDLNCLTEWTHAQIVTHTRQLLKDLQIDQEIDFKIIRGTREAAKADEESAKTPPSGGGFRRKS